MNVLHVITGLGKAAGTSVFVVELSRALKAQGVSVGIATFNPDSRNDLLKDMKNAVSDVTSVLLGSPSADLVHIHGLWMPVLHSVQKWARRYDVPVVWSPHGMLSPWAMAHKRWKKILPWFLYQKGDLKRAVMLHATSKKEAGWIRDLGFTQKLVIAPLGTHLPSSVPPRQNVRKTILFVGRIYPVKGLAHLIMAWSRLPVEARSGWNIRLVGPDQAGHMDELKQLADRLGVSREIHFSGPLFEEQLDSAYREADVFVLPSFTENFGGVVVDAMSYCLPVITTKGTPWSELQGNSDPSSFVHCCDSALVGEQSAIGNRQSVTGNDSTNALMNFRTNELPPAHTGRAGWWIDIGVEQLAEALKEAMGLSDEERRAMGENGRRLVAARYTWPAIAEQMKAAYAWVLNGGEKPDCVVL